MADNSPLKFVKAAESVNKTLGPMKKSLDAVVTSQRDLNKQYSESEKALAKMQKSLKGVSDTLKTGIGHAKGFLISITGMGLGVKTLYHTAMDLNKTLIGWHNQLQYLSDSTGNATKAVNMMTSAWSKSLAGMSEVQGTMRALAESGMTTSKAMEELTVWNSSLAHAAGISSETLSKMTGTMVSYWQVSTKGAKEVSSAFIATQKVFNTTASQIQQMMQLTTEAQDKLGAFAKDGEKSALALAKGISAAAGAMIKMGVNAQTATSFIDKMMDPTKFGETNVLMRQLGISFEDQMRMMEGAAGKELFFDKMMQNLPRLSKQIQAIQNPLARMQYAQAIGLPPEIAAKMARASAGQMSSIIEEYKKQAKDTKAAEEKQKKAAMAESKFAETMLMFKMQFMQPLMQWAIDFWKKITAARTNLVPMLTNITQKAADFFRAFTDKGFKLLETFNKEGMQGVGKALGPMLKDSLGTIWDTFLPLLTTVGKGLMTGIWEFMKSNPLIMAAFVAITTGKVAGAAGNILDTYKTLSGTEGLLGNIKMPGGAKKILGKAGWLGMGITALSTGYDIYKGVKSGEGAGHVVGSAAGTLTGGVIGGVAVGALGGLLLGPAGAALGKVVGSWAGSAVGGWLANKFMDKALTAEQKKHKLILEDLEKARAKGKELSVDQLKAMKEARAELEKTKGWWSKLADWWEPIGLSFKKYFTNPFMLWLSQANLWVDKITAKVTGHFKQAAIYEKIGDFLYKARNEYGTYDTKGYASAAQGMRAQLSELEAYELSIGKPGEAEAIKNEIKDKIDFLDRLEKQKLKDAQSKADDARIAAEEAKKQRSLLIGYGARTANAVEESLRKDSFKSKSDFLSAYMGSYGLTSVKFVG